MNPCKRILFFRSNIMLTGTIPSTMIWRIRPNSRVAVETKEILTCTKTHQSGQIFALRTVCNLKNNRGIGDPGLVCGVVTEVFVDS